jgi:hypothetical protein
VRDFPSFRFYPSLPTIGNEKDEKVTILWKKLNRFIDEQSKILKG